MPPANSTRGPKKAAAEEAAVSAAEDVTPEGPAAQEGMTDPGQCALGEVLDSILEDAMASIFEGTRLPTEDEARLRAAKFLHPSSGFGIRQPRSKPEEREHHIVVRDQTTDSFAHLVDLKALFDAGILDEGEYKAKKADILRRVY